MNESIFDKSQAIFLSDDTTCDSEAMFIQATYTAKSNHSNKT